MAEDVVTVNEDVVETFQQMTAGGASLAGVERKLAGFGVPQPVIAAARIAYEKRVGLIKQLKDPEVLVDKETREGAWYAGPTPSDTFWPGLRQVLAGALPAAALESVDSSSNRVVGLLRPPGAVKIRTRGLVLGHVQSGKTTSFMAVSAKSVDVGYRLVVVLSGLTDNLRSQTQARLEQQLVGDLASKWFLLTDSERDFQRTDNAAPLMSNTQLRLLAVVKKNPYRLRRLAEWIESAGEAARLSCPILIVDDEADQASIDVGSKRMSTINKLIRRILDNPKAAYVAYTATPFANLLIDPALEEGLYPRDFIVSLRAGEGYYGPERIFGRDLLEHVEDDRSAAPDDVVRSIPETEAPAVQPPRGKGAVYEWAPSVAGSLRSAVNWFVLATAARWARGADDAHSSMLVHTSMLSEAHFRLHQVVDAYKCWLEDELIDPEAAAWDSLEGQWEAEHGRVDRATDEASVGWLEVREQVRKVLADCRIVVDNFRSAERLEYSEDSSTTVIAIGGNTLSRGLTLEGLVCSYFVRAASAYDTLLQMGRWFGYRAGYSDLVRIWITDELAQWFGDLATVEAEIRQEISRYETEDLRPSQLAVKIRTHPAMTITARAKMRSAVNASLDYSGKREQTILFKERDASWLAGNWQAAEDLLAAAIDDAGVEEGVVDGTGRFVLKGVPTSRILTFLDNYQFHPDAVRLKSTLLRKYIESERDAGMTAWNVVVVSNRDSVAGTRQLGVAGEVNLVRRSKMKISRPGVANIKALAGSQDRAADLGEALLSQLGSNPSDAEIRRLRQDVAGVPVLALYPICRRSGVTSSGDRTELRAADDVMGAVLFFPERVGAGSVVTYVSGDLGDIDEVEGYEDELAAVDKADEDAAEQTPDIVSGEEFKG